MKWKNIRSSGKTLGVAPLTKGVHELDFGSAILDPVSTVMKVKYCSYRNDPLFVNTDPKFQPQLQKKQWRERLLLAHPLFYI